MRTQLVLLAVSLLGIIGGAFLIGLWAVGCAVIFDSLALGAYAMWGYDDGNAPQVHGMGDDGSLAESRAFIDRVRPRAS